jgi:predicted ATPase
MTSRQHPLSATSTPLVGREEEKRRLQECFQHILQEEQETPATMVFVHGKSGVGKTALIESCLQEEKGSSSRSKLWMATGKFEQFQDISRARPYSAILKALDGLGHQVGQTENDLLEQHMKDALKYEGHILTKMVPSLALYDDNNAQVVVGEMATQVTLPAERLAVALLTFLNHFCAFVGPLVMFLDDVQWADPHSQQLLLTMVGGGNNHIQNFLLLAGHRDQDDDDDNAPSNILQLHWNAPSPSVCNIHVKDLTVEQVEQLLRSVLRVFDDDEQTPPNNRRDVRGLAQIVFHKTFGNPYYVLQQLEYLHNAQEPILQYNFATANWEWDLEQVRLYSNSSDNVVHVVTSRVARVPVRVKRLLQLASCLGYFVEMNVLQMLEQRMFGDMADSDDLGLDAILTCLETEPHVPTDPPQRRRLLQDRQQTSGEGGSEQDSRVDENTPEVTPDAADAFRRALALAEKEAFVECANGIMKFSHDRIQQTVYELLVEESLIAQQQQHGQESSAESDAVHFSPPPVITPAIPAEPTKLLSSPQQNRTRPVDVVHYRIGTTLKDHWEATQEERFLFLAVEQLDRVSDSYLLAKLSRGETLALMALNHEASKLAKKKGAVQRVSAFLNKAISLAHSQSSFWRTHYEMMLELYNSSAEVEFGLGRLDAATGRIAVIRDHAVLESDQVRSMVIQFQMHGHQRQFDRAIAEGRKILKLLGEPIPKTSLLNIMREYFACKKECRGKPDSFFLELRKSKKAHIPTVLKVLQISSVYGWNGDPLYSGLAFLRAMRITVREGSDTTTPFIYSGFAYMLGLFNDEKEAFRFGELALSKNDGKTTFPSSCCLTYPSVMHLQLPIAVGLEPLLSSYRVGLETGDLFFGTINISIYSIVYFSSGLPLGPLAADMRNYMSQLKICKQDIPLAFILPTCQLALNLMGKSQDPLDLSRAAIQRTQPEYFSENVLLDKNDASVLYMMYLEAFELYILGADIARVEAALREIYKLPEARLGGPHIMNYFFVFVDGLIGLRLSRYASTNKPAKWRRTRRFGNKISNGAIKVLQSWVKTRPVNSWCLLALLDAEKKSRNRGVSLQDGKRLFDRAISQFARSGLVHYGAIANELAGLYMLEKKDQFWAQHYLSQACIRYSQWDAHVKVDMIRVKYEFVNFDEKESARFAIQGKSRFDTTRDSMECSSSSLRASMENVLTRSQRRSVESLRLSSKRLPSLRVSGLQE